MLNSTIHFFNLANPNKTLFIMTAVKKAYL